YIAPKDQFNIIINEIQDDMHKQVDYFEQVGKVIEATRLKERVTFDIEMMKELGYCSGIENYSRYLDRRQPGERPFCLLDYFPKDFLMVIDESHATVPQVRGMYGGDRSRKTVLVEYGFRLPSALDNRPLNFDEFMKMTNQLIYVSATPAEFEIQNSMVGNEKYFPHKRQRIGKEEIIPFVLPGETVAAVSDRRAKTIGAQRAPLQQSRAQISRTDEPLEKFDAGSPGAPLVVEQIIRPTGLLDPRITIKPLKNQIDD